MRLLSVACLSIAAKVEETNVPLSIELQVRKNYLIIDQREFLLFTIFNLIIISLFLGWGDMGRR